jgi:hypothetical protein
VANFEVIIQVADPDIQIVYGTGYRRSGVGCCHCLRKWHYDPLEVVGVLLNPMATGFRLGLVQEGQGPLLELTAALSGNDLDGPSMTPRSATSIWPPRL